MAEILDARVKQKTGVAADFAGFTLLEGEFALVRSSADGPVINYKVGPGVFEDLPWSLQVPGSIASVSPSTDFSGLPAGLYLPDADGTYDGTVPVDLTEGVTYLNWDGSTLTKQVYPINLAGYATVNRVDGIETIMSTVLPVTGVITSDNLLDNSTFMFNRWSATGGVQVNPNYLRALVPVDEDRIDKAVPVTLSGGFDVGADPGLRFSWFDRNMNFISGTPGPTMGTGITAIKPAGCAFIGVNIAANGNMGDDPHNTIYKDTAMMVWGETAQPWKPYKAGVPIDYIFNMPPIAGMMTSENLLDNDKFMFDRWSVTGGVQVNANYLRALVPVDEEKIDIAVPVTLSGGFDVGAAPGLRFAWFDRDMNFISGTPGPTMGTGITAIKPAGCAFIGVNIAANGNMGDDPHNTIYKDTAMMVWGEEVKSWKPYKPGIAADYVIGLVPADLTHIEQEIQDVDNKAESAQSSANAALSAAQQAESNANAYTDGKTWGTTAIQNEAITPAKLSQTTVDLINSSGGGTINNAADDEDLANVDNLLKFKDGAEGFARVRKKNTYTDQRAELLAKADFGFIQIKDEIDLTNNGARPTIVLPDNLTIRFVGNGKLKNCLIYAKNLNIQAARTKIFDNVQLYHYRYGGVVIPCSESDPTKIAIPDTYAVDFFDKNTRSAVLASSLPVVDPLVVKPMHAKIADLPNIVNQSGWKLVIGGTTYWSFEMSGSDVVIPVSDKYIFFNNSTDAPLAGGTIISPALVKGTYLSDYDRVSRCNIEGEMYPEWWGAVSDRVTDCTDAFNLAIRACRGQAGGVLSLANAGRGVYLTRGGIVMLSYCYLKGNMATIEAMANSENHMFITDNITMLVRFDIDNLILEGKAPNQTLDIDIFHVDWTYGQPFFTSDASYCWSDSTLFNVWANYGKRDGFHVACPGDLEVTNCRAKANGRDGFHSLKEHFRILDCRAQGNGRDGFHYDGANHFSIIGSRSSHNGRHSFYFANCVQFQVVGAMAYDAGTGDCFHLENSIRFLFTNAVAMNAQSGRGIFVDAASNNGAFVGVGIGFTSVPVENLGTDVSVVNVVEF